jgi:hypothetical protein
MTAVCSNIPNGLYRGIDRLQHTVAQGSQTYRILVIVRICWGLLCTGFHSCYRRQYFGFLSWDLEVTLLIIIGGAVIELQWWGVTGFLRHQRGIFSCHCSTFVPAPHTELHVLCISCCSEWPSMPHYIFCLTCSYHPPVWQRHWKHKIPLSVGTIILKHHHRHRRRYVVLQIFRFDSDCSFGFLHCVVIVFRHFRSMYCLYLQVQWIGVTGCWSDG